MSESEVSNKLNPVFNIDSEMPNDSVATGNSMTVALANASSDSGGGMSVASCSLASFC